MSKKAITIAPLQNSKNNNTEISGHMSCQTVMLAPFHEPHTSISLVAKIDNTAVESLAYGHSRGRLRVFSSHARPQLSPAAAVVPQSTGMVLTIGFNTWIRGLPTQKAAPPLNSPGN